MILHAATTNKGKLAEFTLSAAAKGIRVEALPAIEKMPEPPEDAATFMGNAEIKASEYSRLASGLLVLADDSGLEVEALGWRPGVRSARFADDLDFRMGNTRDERNNLAVTALLHDLPQALDGASRNGARFVCALAIARDGNILWRAEQSIEGAILDSPRGQLGFGYDPLFLVPSLGLTMAELDRETKWKVSHRGKAFRALLQQLESAF